MTATRLLSEWQFVEHVLQLKIYFTSLYTRHYTIEINEFPRLQITFLRPQKKRKKQEQKK